MQEVHVKLQFNQPCLGHVRAKNLNRMIRDAEGRVMLLPTWWASIANYAAQLLNVPSELIKKVDWCPVVDGVTSVYRRFYEPGKFTLHEAFLPGDIIGLSCVIPDGMTPATLSEVLDVAGKYRGMCPYKPEKKQGTFAVVEIEPLIRNFQA